jgi:O-acetyl-ADP-ribose deacetylase (regulator of RNase III)
MGNIIDRTGSLFDSKAQAIGHGINVDGKMAAGIAAEFARVYPDMVKEYVALCKEGNITPGKAWVWQDPKSDDIVLNIASQDRPGRHAKLSWLRTGTVDAINQLRSLHPDIDRIALPHIGCGIGGLDWEDVQEILEDIAESMDIDIEVWVF